MDAIAANANVIHPVLLCRLILLHSILSPCSPLESAHSPQGLRRPLHKHSEPVRVLHGLQRIPRPPRPLFPPDVASAGNAPPETLARYRAPIVACVREVRTALLQYLRRRLRVRAWTHIGTSHDLRLTREQ